MDKPSFTNGDREVVRVSVERLGPNLASHRRLI